jgi:hypothetical protein
VNEERDDGSTRQKIPPCECLDRLPNWLTKIVGQALKLPRAGSWRGWPVKRVIPSDGNSSGSLLPVTHAAHSSHEILPEAESFIRRRYRVGSCRRKQQSTRDEYGEALLDTERGEMLRWQ